MDPTLDKIKIWKISQNLDEIAIFSRIAKKKKERSDRNLRLEQSFPTVFSLGPGGKSVTRNQFPHDLGKTSYILPRRAMHWYGFLGGMSVVGFSCES